jgi:hypothetical protein
VCACASVDPSSKLIILFGDPAQLSSVCYHKVEEHAMCRKCHITTSSYWSSATRYHLEASLRHASDQDLIIALSLAREGPLPQSVIDHVFGPCVMSASSIADEYDDETTIICTHRCDVDMMNATLLKIRHPDYMPIPLQTNVPNDMVELGLWVKKPNFHSLVRVALGCRVMLTKNLDITKGGCNGAEGTAVGLKLYPDGTLKAVVMELDSGVVITVYRSDIKYKFLNGIRYRKATFPLMLCYAITGHKCQGATITGHVVLLIREVFCPGLLYVMLSRVLDRKQLRIVGKLTTKMFIPVPKKFLK